MFSVNCSNEIQENGCSDVTWLKFLAIKAVFYINSNYSDDDCAAEEEEEEYESTMLALSWYKMTSTLTVHFKLELKRLEKQKYDPS